jgi:Family of unknown function (DUF6505)
VKLLRTIRLDASDSFVFAAAAEPGEWAVSGAFVFWHKDPATLDGKARAAFRSGLLGVRSLGWSTLVQIVEASAAERAGVVELLAEQLTRHFGAPNLDAARAAAEEEVAFAQSLCSMPAGSVVAVHRSYEDGAVRESFRSLRPREGGKPAGVFAFLEVEGEDEPSETIDEAIDLAALAKREHK